MAAAASMPAPRPGPNPINEQAQADLNHVQFALRDYALMFEGNPVGTNAEITKALRGDNPKGTRFPTPEGSTINSSGELCDRWGTPYFFHQLSKTKMEVRSAGPDREMWTPDDIQR